MFEAVMQRENREKGFFVAFDFTLDAVQEARRFKDRTGKEIRCITVRELIEDEQVMKRIPPSRAKAISVAPSRKKSS